jgi:dephospho-CoA kinase
MGNPRKKFLVGLTGGIGSGKSTVADLFASRGVTLVDADVISHELTGPGGGAMSAIEEAFGASVVASDGRLDRAAMRQLAFSDPASRARLQAILHPMIRQASEARIAAATGPYVLSVVPLLVESGNWRQRVDRVLVVDCTEEVQVARVLKRSGLSREEVLAIMASQASRAQRLAAADDVIDNSGQAGALDEQVAVLHQRYLQAAMAAGLSTRAL